MGWVTIAIPTGRPFGPTLALLEQAGIGTALFQSLTDRRLVVEDAERQLRFVLCKPSAVPIFVSMGAADLGMVGSDVLLETEPDVVDVMDLDYLHCRLVLAGPPAFDKPRTAGSGRLLRVATKFPRLTSRHLRRYWDSMEILYVPGSVEATVLLGVADVIVDLVETGQTLRDNGLAEMRTLMQCSGHLIANRRSLKPASTSLTSLIDRFASTVNLAKTS